MKLSIVIPSYCADQYLKGVLLAIDRQISSDIEVVIVDCSPDLNVSNIVREFSFATLYTEQERFNPGQGRNIGATYAQGKSLVFIDADVVLADGAIQAIIKHAEAGHKAFGATLELNENVSNDFAAKVEHYYFNHESHSTRTASTRQNFSSVFMVVEKETFLASGGFADIRRMQDTELTESMVNTGITLYFPPDSIWYQIQDSVLSKVLNMIRITGNNLYFIRYQKSNNLLSKLFFILLLPFMMLSKITRINLRKKSYKFSFSMLFIYCPFMCVCGVYWLMGFAKEVVSNAGIEAGR
jgi:glycosyltransferase involved in cell wall biosynthesis